MQTEYQNKQMGPEEASTKEAVQETSKLKKKKYYFPQQGVTVEATSLADAEGEMKKKLAEKRKKK